MASDRVHVDGYELFHLACDRSYPAVVEELLQRDDIDKTTTGIDGSSWLHEAASNGCTDAASELIFKHRSDINKQRSDGATPLICALRRTHGKVVTMLLEAGADVNMALVDGRTPLYFAASHFKDDLLEQLLRHGSNVGAITSRGESALHEACRHAFPTVVRRLLLHGADPVRRNKRGETPLELACMGHPKTVKVLLDNGADLLQRNSTGASYLYQACQRRFAEVVAVLLDRGADPNAVELGSTPFLAACWAGSVEIVHVLLSHGADVRAATHIYGITGLHAVCYPTTGVESSSDSLYRLARTMIREGADVNARMLNNITPLHVACKYFRAGAIKALGNAGADPLAVHVNPVTTRGITPIHLLSRHLFAAEALRFLVCRAPGDRLEDVFGSTWSPLHEAATSVSSASVSMLLEHGANPMALTEDGRTALHLLFARFEANPFPDWAEGINQALEVVAALTKCDGFDINHRDNGGATALGLAGDTCPARLEV
ncbi:Ankyrin repeat-containing domain protein [Cordyceps fumosorosea ARSEF 2679]|uniref:Ankyrin repeat-containing domain protein n=1 Tax=Cordyceps fumosorosea (strain ARSEF 2679) TaxID=1081104 RepID=A0A168AL36_CORFA|nr:Ankyrin repeat-containing domain protein [Cordyceps fumosorosea ARSEF 2679]OAA68897.1 Ankyrin repeat-containing domain protein [Cordyceps fumosorosea ARSEF 2679]